MTIEMTIAKKKWCILFAYRPPNFSKNEFFEEISETLNKALNEYDNLFLAADLNINTLRPTSDSSNHFSDLNNTFSLTNLVTDNFLRDLDARLIQGEPYKNCGNPYTKISEISSEVLNYHGPLKLKSVRGNHAPFMTRELSKAIMTKSKVKNSYVNWPSRENFIAYNKAKNKCNSLTTKAKRKSFKEATKSGGCLIEPFGRQ